MDTGITFNLNIVPEFIKSLNDCNSKTFNIQKITYNDDKRKKYKLISYDKYITIDKSETFGLINSIICNNNNQIISFLPPKTLNYNFFKKKHSEVSSFQDIQQQELIEGIILNLFWDPCIGLSGSWEIFTKGNIGGKNTIYNNTTTREIFMDLLNKHVFTLDNFDKNYCYTFILQYPKCNIVNPNKHPRLHMIKIYYIQTQKDSNMKIISVIVNDITLSEINKYNQLAYQKYNYTSFQQIENYYNNLLLPYHNMGIVLFNTKTGFTTKFKNPVHELVFKKRYDNHKTSSQYLYFELMKKGTLNDYLKKFPQRNNEFWEYRREYINFENALFNNYFSCFVKKEKNIQQFPLYIRYHMIKLHNIYLHSCYQKERKIINISKVSDYLKNIDTSHLVYTINYPNHCCSIDKINYTTSFSI